MWQRPGGQIALTSWTPSGFIGDRFKVTGRHVSPLPGLPSPLLASRRPRRSAHWHPATRHCLPRPPEGRWRCLQPDIGDRRLRMTALAIWRNSATGYDRKPSLRVIERTTSLLPDQRAHLLSLPAPVEPSLRRIRIHLRPDLLSAWSDSTRSRQLRHGRHPRMQNIRPSGRKRECHG